MDTFIKSLIIILLSNPLYWIIIVLGIISVIFYNNIIGFMGEFWVKCELSKLPKDKYMLLNNIMLKMDNLTVQIDHLVISKYGIFVIETKNYGGLIIGNKYDDNWLQYLGKNKSFFHSPLRQNYCHIKCLSSILDIDESKFISIVCFNNRARLKVNAVNVLNINKLNTYIRSFNNVIVSEDLKLLKNKVVSLNITNKNDRKEHNKVIKDKRYPMSKIN